MLRRLRAFLRQRDGSIAVEFAFIAPLMLVLFFGLVDLAEALGCRADVDNLASAGADLIAQESQVTAADMSNVFAALSAMLYPYDAAPATITISSIVDEGVGKSPQVAWSCSQGGTPRSTGPYTFPASAANVLTPGSGGSVILAEVTYSYPFPVNIALGGFHLTGPIALSSSFYSKPRRVLQIPGPGTGTANCSA